MFPPTLELIECNDLYNVLNAEIDGLARISDTNYLYLLGRFPFDRRVSIHFCLFEQIVDRAKITMKATSSVLG